MIVLRCGSVEVYGDILMGIFVCFCAELFLFLGLYEMVEVDD